MKTRVYSFRHLLERIMNTPELEVAMVESVLKERGFTQLPGATTMLTSFESLDPTPWAFAVLIRFPLTQYLVVMQSMNDYINFMSFYQPRLAVFDRLAPA